MTKEYQYNGKTYRLKPLTLGVMKSVIPLLARLRKLQYEYTKNIDMSDVNSEKQRLSELETAKEQLSEMFEGEISHEERISISDKISCLNDKIYVHKTNIENNEAFRQKIKLFNECSALAVYEVITDMEIIKPVIEAVLTSDGESHDINFDDPGCLKFLTQVIADFFLLIQTNKLKLSG